MAAFDAAGALVDATGVQIPGVLDDVYGGAARRDLGVTWRHGVPRFAVWAPTAKSVHLLIGSGRVPMTRDRDGVWQTTGSRSWKGATYAYEVRVFAPSSGRVETNVVTDPYSVALTTDSTRSVVADLADRSLIAGRLGPAAQARRDPGRGRPRLRAARAGLLDQRRDGAGRASRHVPRVHRRRQRRAWRTCAGSPPAASTTCTCCRPSTSPRSTENRADQQTPACDLPSFPPDSEAQQDCVDAVRATDGFNWGYDPWHYTTPEGSYAVDPAGAARTREFRAMVAGINRAGLRAVMDVVYNHTTASGQNEKSVLDRIVPGYYHRLTPTGQQETSTCCANTATEHRMMEKLMIDSLVTWAREYKVDGFRFDLMGHHSKANMRDVRRALDRLTLGRDGVDGKAILLYGEGWNFGEVANDARFVQATQANMAGTGIGTFSDRLRDAVRGGGPFDEDPRIQGFGSGLYTDPNGAPVNGAPADQLARLLLYQDQIKVGLAGNLRSYTFVDRTGATVTGSDVDYNGQPAGYAADPSETVTYVDAHDNETLFDALQYKLPQPTLDGRPGADEHGVAGDDGVRAGDRVLARRHRPAALEVAGPQLVRLRRLVQPDRLVRHRVDVGLGPAAERGQREQVGRTCVRCWGSGARTRRRPTSRPPPRGRTSCSASRRPRRCSGSTAPPTSSAGSGSRWAGPPRRRA